MKIPRTLILKKPDYQEGEVITQAKIPILVHKNTLQQPLEDITEHEIRIKKGLTKDKTIVDGKTYTGRKQKKIILAEQYKPNNLIKIISYATIGLFTIINSQNCSKNNGTPNTPTTPVQANLSFEVYNHTKGRITNADFRKEGVWSETWLEIPINEINATAIDSLRGVIRTNQGDIGTLEYFTKDGTLAIPNTPRKDTHYKLYLMNAGARYDLIDEWKDKPDHGGILEHPRDASWHLENQDEPKYHIQENIANYVMNQFTNAISHNWGNYGSFTKLESGGNFGVGGGKCGGDAGTHNAIWAGVNPIETLNLIIPHPITVKGVLYEEVAELLNRHGDLGGFDGGTYDNITDGINLTQNGIDLINYVYITSN